MLRFLVTWMILCVSLGSLVASLYEIVYPIMTPRPLSSGIGYQEILKEVKFTCCADTIAGALKETEKLKETDKKCQISDE